VVELPGGRTAFFLGDVTGKGVGAGVLMVATQTKLGAMLASGASLADAIGMLNSFVIERTDCGRFVTLLAAMWNPADRVLEIIDAGHGYCCVRAPGESSRCLELGGNPPVGVVAGLTFKVRRMTLAERTRVVLFSDGVVEQRDHGGEMFGLDAAIEAMEGARSVEEDVDCLVRAVKSHAGGPLADDLTVASIAFDPGPAD